MGLVDDGRYDRRRDDEESAELTDDVYVDEDEYSDEVSEVSPAPQPRQRPKPAVVPKPEEPELADLSRIVSVRPRSYNEARIIGENFRDGVPVIMNLSDMEEGDDKRLVDFAAGLIFGLRGNIDRVSSKVFLLCPPGLVVGPEDKERIASGGFFNQS
ncbi:MAG: cell division protein SepF [Propionibacterium sp.]|nr:cell division protein SepF [Propionibacterium sp.]